MLTVYGIETQSQGPTVLIILIVATVLTVYGIETWLTGVTKDNNLSLLCCNSAYRLRY